MENYELNKIKVGYEVIAEYYERDGGTITGIVEKIEGSNIKLEGDHALHPAEDFYIVPKIGDVVNYPSGRLGFHGEEMMSILGTVTDEKDGKFQVNGKGRYFKPSELEFVRRYSHDNVNHPSHYTSHPSGVECIEITRHYCFAIGNAIKYLWRAGLKQEADKDSREKEIEDLQKAVWYINDRIKQLKGE